MPERYCMAASRPRPLLVILGSVLVLSLCFAVGLGLYADQRQKQVQSELEPYRAVAAQILAAQQAAGGSPAVAQATDDALQALAPAARSVEVTPKGSAAEQLESSVGSLLQMAVHQTDGDLRSQAFFGAVKLWSAAQTDGLIDTAYPAELEKLQQAQDATCPAPAEGAQQQAGAGPSSPSLDYLQAALHELAYSSQVYAARSGQGYGDVAARADELAEAASSSLTSLTPALVCADRLAEAEASYPVATPDQAAAELDRLVLAVHTNALAALTDPILADAPESLDLAVAAVALDPSYLPAN